MATFTLTFTWNIKYWWQSRGWAPGVLLTTLSLSLTLNIVLWHRRWCRWWVGGWLMVTFTLTVCLTFTFTLNNKHDSECGKDYEEMDDSCSLSLSLSLLLWTINMKERMVQMMSRWVTHGPFHFHYLSHFHFSYHFHLEHFLMTERMVQMMSRWVTHGPARCSPGPAQLTKLASGGSAG